MSWFQPPMVLLPELIARHGKWRAEHIAFADEQRSLTWGTFASQTAQVANGLQADGLQPGERIALLMDNSLEMAVALFGILRSGCVAVPLNPAITDAAVISMIEDAAVRAAFASGAHCARLEALAVQSAPIAAARKFSVQQPTEGWRDFDAWREAQPIGLEPREIAADAECNIIYSSGTTGVPKGIVHTHACRLQWGAELASVLRYRSDSVVLCSLGLFSNISWVSMLAAVYVGARVVVMRRFEAAAALKLMQHAQVTHGNFVPLQLQQLLAAPELVTTDLDSLDTLMVCGAPVRLEIKLAVPQRMGCALIELYGLTEGFCTILAPEDFAEHARSVGKPFLGSDMRIIGEDECELPAGMTGEIVGLGPLLMAGYHNREAASAEATWLDRQGRRWLRTGDLGYVDEHGFLFVVDRKKDMILSGGQNIYPADIEEVMRQHPDVAEVAVVAATSRKWGETPVAVVVVHGDRAPDRAALIAWTNERVGRQQRIADVIWRPSLPRNANGKVLKRELRMEVSTYE